MLGKKIAEIRKNRGYTLTELAHKTNISKSYLSNLERELNQNPSLQVLLKLSQVLKVKLETFFEPVIGDEKRMYHDKDWIQFITELKKADLDKEQLKEYKLMLEFVKWKKERTASSEDNSNK